MRAVIQRVSNAGVTIGGEVFSEIGRGLLVLVGFARGDGREEAEYLAGKCVGLRIFEDGQGKMNLEAKDVGGEFLIVPNFTLYGDCSRGKRPDFLAAERFDKAVPLYEEFLNQCRSLGARVKTGSFGADMQVSLTNDGPVTIFMDTDLMRMK